MGRAFVKVAGVVYTLHFKVSSQCYRQGMVKERGQFDDFCVLILSRGSRSSSEPWLCFQGISLCVTCSGHDDNNVWTGSVAARKDYDGWK